MHVGDIPEENIFHTSSPTETAAPNCPIQCKAANVLLLSAQWRMTISWSCIFFIKQLSTRFAFFYFSKKVFTIWSFVIIAVIEFYCLKNNLNRKHPRYFSQSIMFYFMKKLEFLQLVVCTTWKLMSMQSTNKPALKMTWSPLLGKNKISMTTFHESICLHRRTRRGVGGGGRPPGLEKFQGKLCFQGKGKLLKNLK